MLTHANATFLVASPDTSLLAVLEPLLSASGAHVEVAHSAAPVLAVLSAPQTLHLILLDAKLCNTEPWINLGQLLAAARSLPESRRGPIVLIADAVTEEWVVRMAEGTIDDLIPRATEPAFLQLRLETILRTHRVTREFSMLCEAAAVDAQMDQITGVYNRETMLGMLFRETDRVQRMKSSLCMILFDLDDFTHWNALLARRSATSCSARSSPAPCACCAAMT